MPRGWTAARTDRGSWQHRADPADSSHETLPGDKVVGDLSIYQLEVALVDQDGTRSGLKRFAGKPVIISMFYATCPYACPVLIQDIKGIEAKLTTHERSNTAVLLVSFDPARDTVAVLKKLASVQEVDERRWKLCRTSADEARELAAVLGIKYRMLQNGGINHSSIITLLDRTGTIVSRIDGLKRDSAELVSRLRAELKR